jgi:hypothetical protein
MNNSGEPVIPYKGDITNLALLNQSRPYRAFLKENKAGMSKYISA